MSVLNYKDKGVREALRDFGQIIEDTRESKDSVDLTILTNDHEVQGALLELIDREELDHRIELGGKIHVTVE